MGATAYYQVLDSPLISYMTNGTSTNYDSQINPDNVDHSTHLFVLVALWIILLVTIIFGTTGNILVLYVYINRKDNKTCTFFIKMLAVVDLIICLFLAPLELYQITAGIRNEFLCKFYGFLSTHVLYSTLLITTIAFDRYFCICWPLYKIITIHRARAIVISCGILSSLLAIIPMTEFSTTEHVFQIHHNHSERLSIKHSDEDGPVAYKHVEHFKKTDATASFIVGNLTDVSCSPKFNLHLGSATFLDAYRTFHSALFAACILLVLILYAFIYNAVYQRRVTRTRKLSAYRRIIRSYLMNNERENPEARTSKTIHHHDHFHRGHPPSTLTLLCCYCCRTANEYTHDLQRPSESVFHEPLSPQRRQFNHHIHDEQSSVITSQHRKKPQVVLEVNGARGKRYSAISMTSMTYLTSGIWDETTSSNLIRSRINSIAATSYCGAEHSSNSRPSTSTEDSLEQTTKLLTLNNAIQLRPMTSSSSSHLTVPGQQVTTPTTPSLLIPTSADVINKDNQLNESESPIIIPQGTSLRHSSIARKSSNTLSTRQQQRLSDVSVHQRKVSFMTSAGIADQCISEDSPNTYQRSSLAPPIASLSINPAQLQQQPQQQHQLSVHISDKRSLSTASSIDNTSASIRNFSISSTRRPSTFDCETQRILERQQTQERLANIRTTFTLFIVTATFIMMYLPSIIHALFKIEPHNFREILFLLYYINSACNPLIYSFFNVNFRNDIRRIYECQKREYFARQY